MLNTQLLNFTMKIGEEDKAILMLASLPPSYDHPVTTLLYGKENLVFEEVTKSLLSHEMRRKPIDDQADGLMARFEPNRRREISLRERMVEVSSIGLCHDWHRVENLGQMQKM
jgi:hypothetical protein